MVQSMKIPHVNLVPWSESNLDLLRKINAPEMMEHLGGSETEAQLLIRHQRYLEIGGKGSGRMYSIILLPDNETVGSIGYWDSKWEEESIYEMGWSVLPTYQGRGIATAAVLEAIANANMEKKHKYIHAFPSIHNPASNAVCQKLGFQLTSDCEFEYPPGNFMQCNDWRLGLDL
ncbi:GNAT family N-acetyltransferase [Paenibacillus sp. MAH-36]